MSFDDADRLKIRQAPDPDSPHRAWITAGREKFRPIRAEGNRIHIAGKMPEAMNDSLLLDGPNLHFARPSCGGGWACDRDLDLRQTANPFPVTERRYASPPPCWNGHACR